MLASVLAGLTLLGAPPQDAAAQGPAAQDPAPSQVEDVVVWGRRSIQEQARDYVEAVGAPPGRRRLATWDRRVCVSVMGIDAVYAQFLVDRISAVAASVGLEPGLPGCKPDVLIAFSRDPDGVAQSWVRRDLDAFRPSWFGQTDLGGDALEAFKSSDAPIRWWHVSLSVNAETGLSVTPTTRNPGPIFNRVSIPSLIQSPTREALKRAFIIVDGERIGDVSFGSLSDYLAFIALTQVDPSPDAVAMDTILNLFSGPSTARLSAWDADYLQSLYNQRSNPIRASTQARHLSRGLAGRRSQDLPGA